MAESTTSVAKIKQSINEHVQEVNETVSNTTKDLGLLTKDLVQKESAMIQSFKEHAVQDLKDVQLNYAEKEKKVLNLLKSTKSNANSKRSSTNSQDVANDYENILQENIVKLKEIAKEDFTTSNRNAQNLIDETKTKLHRFISKAFKEDDSKKDFSKTAEAIFASVNKKIIDDLYAKSHTAQRTTSTLRPDISNVFVHPMNKPPEEIEAEQLLQKLFEEELLQFNAQIKKDFQDINLEMMGRIDDTKNKFNETIQSITSKGISKVNSSEVAEAQSLPNFPTTSTVEKNVDSLLRKAGQDFEQVRGNMLNDVTKNKQKINDNVKYYAEKVLGKEYLHTDEDE